MIILYLVILLFASMSVLFFCGKGSWLIAGYNTASDDEKPQYDEEKLTRIMGIGMLIITILLILMALGILKHFFIIGIIAVVIGLFVASDIVAHEEHHLHKATKIMITLLLVFGIGLEGCMHVGSIEVDMQKDGIHLSGLNLKKRTIEYEDIQAIKYTENFDIGSRKGGWGSYQLQLGVFENESGEYDLYAYTACDAYIILETDKRRIVFNGETKKATLRYYNHLKLKLGY